MTHLADFPTAAAIAIAVLLVVGATLTLIGNLGLLMLRDFYQRLHAPTLGASWGTAAVAIASMLTFSLLRGEPAIHEVAICVFIVVTTPIGLLMLGRAARRRDFGDRAPPGLDRAPDLEGDGPDPAGPTAPGSIPNAGTRAPEPGRPRPRG